MSSKGKGSQTKMSGTVSIPFLLVLCRLKPKQPKPKQKQKQKQKKLTLLGAVVGGRSIYWRRPQGPSRLSPATWVATSPTRLTKKSATARPGMLRLWRLLSTHLRLPLKNWLNYFLRFTTRPRSTGRDRT